LAFDELLGVGSGQRLRQVRETSDRAGLMGTANLAELRLP
jgi:hypothetical protein